MTTPPNTNGNGNGNGNGYTQKEMLVAIMAKLDSMQAGLEAARLDFAVHEAKPHHDAARAEIDELRRDVSAATRKLALYAGGLAVMAFLVQVAVRFIQ